MNFEGIEGRVGREGGQDHLSDLIASIQRDSAATGGVCVSGRGIWIWPFISFFFLPLHPFCFMGRTVEKRRRKKKKAQTEKKMRSHHHAEESS